MVPASCAAARSGKAVRMPASSTAPAERVRRNTVIMARVFNGKVEAEIREDCASACNLCLMISGTP
ncbi:hypothetical protein ACVIIV_003990 [Bradyrhizobium sp. USDA 4354]